jgi:hypothetical protein
MTKIEKILQDPKFNIHSEKETRKSIPNANFTPEPALVVHRGQLKTNDELKKEVKEKIETRKKLADASTDEEFQELFNVVMGLIDKPDFWELIPDNIITKCYAYTVAEMSKRKIGKPILPETKG